MRRRPALFTVAALSLVLAACTDASETNTDSADNAATAGDESTQQSSGETPDFDISTVEEDPEVAALVPAEVAADGMLTNGLSANYPPAEFFGADGTTITGYDVQLGQAAARKMGLELDSQHAEFASIIPGIGTKFEVGISNFSVTPERLEAVNFTTYLEAGSGWAVAAGNPAGFDPNAVCGGVVGVQTGTIQHDAAIAMREECAAEGQDLTVTPYPSQQDVTTNLMGGKVDAMYADAPVVTDAILKTDSAVEQVGDLTDAQLVGAVTAKDDQELAEALRAAFQSLMDDGTYTAILDEWSVDAGRLDTAEVNPSPES